MMTNLVLSSPKGGYMPSNRVGITTLLRRGWQYWKSPNFSLPKLYEWGGGGLPRAWSFGWETGKDGDLICVRAKVEDTLQGEMALSPACHSRVEATLAFVLKAILVRMDTNITSVLKG